MSMQKAAGASSADILVIEDSDDMAFVIKEFLTFEGYAVVTARSLSEAWRILAAHRVRLLIIDVILRDGQGFSILPQIQEQGIPYILISGSPELLQSHPLPPGCLSLPKPFWPSALLEAVKDCIAPPTPERPE